MRPWLRTILVGAGVLGILGAQCPPVTAGDFTRIPVVVDKKSVAHRLAKKRGHGHDGGGGSSDPDGSCYLDEFTPQEYERYQYGPRGPDTEWYWSRTDPGKWVWRVCPDRANPAERRTPRFLPDDPVKVVDAGATVTPAMVRWWAYSLLVLSDPDFEMSPSFVNTVKPPLVGMPTYWWVRERTEHVQKHVREVHAGPYWVRATAKPVRLWAETSDGTVVDCPDGGEEYQMRPTSCAVVFPHSGDVTMTVRVEWRISWESNYDRPGEERDRVITEHSEVIPVHERQVVNIARPQ